MSGGSFRADFARLNNLIVSLSKNYRIKVGILSDKDNRKDDTAGNAEIGAINEFGGKRDGVKIPPRSFLRMPIAVKRDQIITEGGKGAEELIARGKVEQMYKRVGTAAVGVINDAFKSRGFGTWAPNEASTIRGKSHGRGKKRKVGDSPLIDTRQLQRSILSKVEPR